MCLQASITCGVLQCVVARCSVLYCVARILGIGADVYLTGLDYLHTPDTATHKPQVFEMTQCNTLQHTAAHCSTLQHTATHCNTPATQSTPALHFDILRYRRQAYIQLTLQHTRRRSYTDTSSLATSFLTDLRP